MAKQLSKDLVNLTVINSVLEADLDKAFRSEIFARKEEVDVEEVSKVILKDGGSLRSERRKSTIKRRQSIKHGIITADCEDWKSAVPDATLQWLQGKISSVKDSPLKNDFETNDFPDIVNSGKK